MAEIFPNAGNFLDNPSHLTPHRVITVDSASPERTVKVAADGSITIGADAGVTNYAKHESTGFLVNNGSACGWEDLRIDDNSVRGGVVSPTIETGFRGDANIQVTNFINNQADEVQFTVQFPHAVKTNSFIYPHVHFSPWITNVGNAAAQFILEYRWADINGQFPVSPSTYTMTKTWSGDQQWYHLLASNVAGINHNAHTVSSLMVCRLYRDNSVANNLAGKITFLYFDIHYIVDTPSGSRNETSK